MTLRLFEGPAGSGKTTRLFQELERTLEVDPLLPSQQVLALTKMHGSRRRMESRLRSIRALGGRYRCSTIDSFAWNIVRRWRSLARTKSIRDVVEGDYEQVCTLAGQLLSEEVVSRWVTRVFRAIVVDEFQDSKGGQLQIIRALSKLAICIAAADEFQDLDPMEPNQAVAFAKGIGECTNLDAIHRTSASGILEAARAAREGHSIPLRGDGFTALGAPKFSVGASFVSNNLTWWHDCHDIAILMPVRPASSPFIRQLIARVEEKPIGNPQVGPHRIRLEISQDEEVDRLDETLGLPQEPNAQVCLADLSVVDGGSLSRGMRTWIDRQINVGGRTVVEVSEVRREAHRIHQRSRAHRFLNDRGVRAMTIHQAKNREFHSVIVLWPYEVAGADERLRRLLYNGITRATHRVLVVVQNPSRLQQSPFMA